MVERAAVLCLGERTKCEGEKQYGAHTKNENRQVTYGRTECLTTVQSEERLTKIRENGNVKMR